MRPVLYGRLSSSRPTRVSRTILSSICPVTRSSVHQTRFKMATRLSKYFGNYPAEYQRAVHGPFCPTRFYGQADTPLAEVKLNQLGSWINRRNLHPVAVTQACSRAYHRWLRAYAHPKYASPVIYFFQFICASSALFYLANYPKNLRHHKMYKYHW